MNDKKHPEPKGGWTQDDRTRRCVTDNCGSGRDECGSWVGTPLSMIYISVFCTDEPNIVVARAGACKRCNRVYTLTLRLDPETHKQVAAGLGISRAGIEACMRTSKNATLFGLEELQSGRMQEVELSFAVQDMIAKRSRGAAARDAEEAMSVYNPDAFTEPEQEVLPF